MSDQKRLRQRRLPMAVASIALLSTALVLGAPRTASATVTPLWTPPADRVPATGSYLATTNDPASAQADAISVSTSADTDIVVDASGGAATITLRNNGWTTLRIGVPTGANRIAVGLYPEAHRFATTTTGQVDFSADGRGCNTTDGRLQVDRADYVGAVLTKLTARFEQTCPDDSLPPIWGQFTWDGTAPIPPAPNPTAIPAGLWRPAPGATPASGNYLYATGYLPPRAPVSFLALGEAVDGGRGPAADDHSYGEQFGIGGSSAAERLGVEVWAPARTAGLEVGYYDDLDGPATSNPVTGGLAATSNDYPCDGTIDSWFAIDELTRVGGDITHIRFRFERTCDHWYDAGVHDDVIRGEVDWTARPTITDVYPSSGERRGGALLGFSGSDLVGVTAATVGGVPATVQHDVFGQLQVVAPPLPLGTYDVTLTAAGGTATAVDAYTSLPNHALGATDVAATGGPISATVTWTPPEDLGDVPPTGIEVALWAYDFQDGDIPRITVTVGPDDTIAQATGLQPGARLVATVTYVDASGRGARAARSPEFTVPEPDVTPFDGVPTLVTQQYVDFAGRAPTTAERNQAVSAIRAGSVLPNAWVASMRNRPEWGGVRGPITRLYSSYFGRLPDASGLSYWARKLRSGTSLARASATFAGSSEFRSRYGTLGDGAFVDLVYRNVLHRSADASGRAHWIRKLAAGTSRGSVMASFSESSEHVRTMLPTVDAVLLYTGMLRRMPTAAELGAAASPARTVAASDPAAVADRLLHSASYAARF